jgi:hypothetical protein
MAPDQEWCLACGAAAVTEVVEARGWRVPLYLGGALIALALIGIVIAIVALSDGKEQVATATPTPTATATVPPGQTPAAIPTSPPITTPTAEPTITAEPSPTEDPLATPTEDPTEEPTAEPTTGTFPGWTGTDGNYTVIIESATTQAKAEEVATDAQDNNGLTVGILNSDEYSSLNGGYYVVFTGDFATKSDAEAELDTVRDTYSDAYIKQIKK